MATAATAKLRAVKPRATKARGSVLTVTEEAAAQIRRLLADAEPGMTLRIGVRTRGCSGNAFHLEYVKEKGKFDEVVEQHGVTLFIESTAIMKIIGSTMDFVVDEDGLREEFVFDNPQAKGMCGCGESWHM